MAEVARFLNLVNAPAKGMGNFKASTGVGGRGKKAVEKRKLKRELDKLLKNKVKAAKALEDHNNEDIGDQFTSATNDSQWDDGSKLSEAHKAGQIVPKSDIESFPGIPAHCIPDMLLVWDFLCTFGRALSLQPIELDDFAAALSFRPSNALQSSNSTQPMETDDQPQQQPPQSYIPVYISECHIALLRLLVKDQTSDLWWWSVLETPEMVEQEDEYLTPILKKRQTAAAVVKIDMEALLSAEEDIDVTRKWIQALEDIRTRKPDNSGPIKSAVKSAISATTNQHVKTYLKKAMRTWKAKSAGLVKRAAVWLLDRMREARPDIFGRPISDEEIVEQKKLVAAEAELEMDAIVEDATVDESDLNLEGDSDEESDSDDDEESDAEDEYADQAETPSSPNKQVTVKENDEITPVTTFVPVKPVPSVVDLLLPPAKPAIPSDLIHALTWPPVVGATSYRIFQWYKRRRNEIDDSIREFRELKPMSVAERRRREMSASLRILSECGDSIEGNANHVESAINHLCDGKGYLDLNAVQRLCILRILIEAAYDTHHVQLSIEDNFKARINAVKALDAEERKAKKTAREELAAIEAAARERLADEARELFIEKKRQEIIEDIKDTKEYSQEFIESLNDDDIIDLDDDTKAEYEALPTPESFNKVDVNAVVKTIQEENALGTDRLQVVSLKEIEQMDEDYLKSLQDEMESLGEPTSREISGQIDRVRLQITKFTDQMQTLPQDRIVAIEGLKDAIEDGTVRTLRTAIKEAKLASLSGDDEYGGIWALDLIRDAALELKDAESRKRVTEAQKDLVAKRNKCFIRTEPLGRDRYQSSYIHFDHDKESRVWAERDLILLSNEDPAPSKDAVLLKSTKRASIGAPDKCDDLVNKDDRDRPYGKSFLAFARQEYHPTKELSSLARHHWSCYSTDRSLRVLVKNLSGKRAKENTLKEVLKETLETMALAAAGGDSSNNATSAEDAGLDDVAAKSDFKASGDEEVFSQAKQSISEDDADLLKDKPSAIGLRVRLRRIPDPDRAPDVANYSMATITGWKMEIVPPSNGHDDEADEETPVPQASLPAPVWRLGLDDGGELHVAAREAVEGIVRAIKWSTGCPGYFEHDAPFLSYRNSSGRFCGKAVEAPSSTTPQAFAKQMIKREQDLYMPLKNRTFENNWGGKAGARQVWVSSLKECGHTFEAVREGLLTLENAFFDLAGGFGVVEENKEGVFAAHLNGDKEESAAQSNGNTEPAAAAQPNGNGGKLSGKDLLYDDTSRFDIELESLANDVQGLWNNSDAREIFQEIIKKSDTVSILALGLDLICRNAQAYINRTKSSVVNQPAASNQQPSEYTGRRRAARASYSDFF